MLTVEALFRYQSKEIKDSILQNYPNGLQVENQPNVIDDRIVFQDE